MALSKKYPFFLLILLNLILDFFEYPKVLTFILFFSAIFIVWNFVNPQVSNFNDSLDLSLLVSKPLPTAINLLPFLSKDDASEYFSTAK